MKNNASIILRKTAASPALRRVMRKQAEGSFLDSAKGWLSNTDKLKNLGVGAGLGLGTYALTGLIPGLKKNRALRLLLGLGAGGAGTYFGGGIRDFADLQARRFKNRFLPNKELQRQEVELAADRDALRAAEDAKNERLANVNNAIAQREQEDITDAKRPQMTYKEWLRTKPDETGLSQRQIERRAQLRADNPSTPQISPQQIAELRAALEAQRKRVEDLKLGSTGRAVRDIKENIGKGVEAAGSGINNLYQKVKGAFGATENEILDEERKLQDLELKARQLGIR